MADNRRIELRISDEFLDRIDQLRATYDMPRATMVKALVQYALSVLEDNGIPAERAVVMPCGPCDASWPERCGHSGAAPDIAKCPAGEGCCCLARQGAA